MSAELARPSPEPVGDGQELAPSREVHRVFVVDDHELLRAGTRRILEDAVGFIVVGEAADGETALDLIATLTPDVVLVDIRLPTMNGIDLAKTIVADYPKSIVLILTAYDDEHYVRAALAAGVAGYLLKTTPSDKLIALIRAACDGLPAVDRGPLGRPTSDTDSDGQARSPRLTQREDEVVRLVARGLANKAIATQLGISVRTVEGHIQHAFEKLGANSRTELVHYALANSLFAMDDHLGAGLF